MISQCRTGRRWWVVVLGAVLTLLAPGYAEDLPQIDAESLTEEHVLAAIDAIVEGLYERRHPTRFWEPHTVRGSQHQVGGHTALVALSLLHAGESYQNPRLREAIEHLKTAELEGTYAVSVRLSLWANLPPRFAPQLRADAQWLLDGFSESVGSWAYYQFPDTERRDNSLRQYGALGLWDAAKRGVRVPTSVWQAIERELLNMQLADGGWNYTGSGPATGSMTAAGLTTLLITQDFLHADEARSLRSRRPSRHEAALDQAMDWMHQHFSATSNPGSGQYFYYYLYGIERVGLAGGHKYFGGRDWYRQGAAELIRRFCHWDSQSRTMTMHERVAGDGAAIANSDLAFGLMFLSRGRLPSVINKLQDDSIRWNNRPRDAPNLAIWIAGETARHVLWQVTDVHAPPEEWLDAPLQMFASNEAVPWAEDSNDVRWQNLKRYLELGGLLFAVNEGSGRAFANSIEAAGRSMFPEYQWRTLPPEHWAYTVHQPVQRQQPRLRGLSNGVRELIIVAVEGDLPGTFQTRNFRNEVQFHTAANVYFYASELDRPRSRFSTFSTSTPKNPPDQTMRTNASIVRARYAGNWNPEPLALEAFAAWMDTEGATVTLDTSPLDRLHQHDPAPELVIISGVQAHELSHGEREAIATYIERGGVMLFETAGGLGDFAHTMERQIEQLFESHAFNAARSRIVTGVGMEAADDLSQLDYRPYTLQAVGSLDTTPRLRGIEVDGQLRVLFTRDDLSHALLDQPCWGVNGYSPRSARRLLRNIVIHAATLND